MTLTVLNPATEEPIAELEQAGVEETDAAVASANAALPEWRRVAPADRGRLLVQKTVYDEFLDSLVTATKGVKVGDPNDPATEMGPLISSAHRETVASFVDDVSVVFRGDAPQGAGFWYPCTLVEATNDDRVAREEVFGPVAAVIPFDDEADAIRIANDTPYGLSGSIWTRDGARALRVARALDTGVISVNSNSSVRVSTPSGASGSPGSAASSACTRSRATRRSRTCSSRRTRTGRRRGG